MANTPKEITINITGSNFDSQEVADRIKAQIEQVSRKINGKLVSPNAMVSEFHTKFGHPVGTEPHMLDDARAEFRWDLVHEEYLEVAEALDNHDLENLAKELADLVYVAYGWAIEMGIDLNAVVQEVHRSNMSKLGADDKPIYREDGKVLKGPNYFEPDIAAVIHRQ